MGKISDKSSYKNMRNAVKSSKNFADRQALKKLRESGLKVEANGLKKN